MNAIVKIVAIPVVLTSLFFVACRKKDGDDNNPQGGKVKMELTHKVGTNPLLLNTAWYTNENGDSFQVSKFNYYISNIQLHQAAGNSYTEAESYHLVEHDKPQSLTFDMANVPAGTYTSMSFLIGIDSFHNVDGAQTGALDPSHGMFWDWNTGYIMFKFEGVSPSSPVPGNKVVLHMGGFTGPNNVLRNVTLNFPQGLVVDNNNPHIHLQADLLEVFKSPNLIDFSQDTLVMTVSPVAKKLADNYADMFKVIAVE